MDPYYEDRTVRLYAGDCLDVLATLPDASVDAVVTDPPYGLEFMGKDWDKFGTVLTDPAEVGGFQDGNGGNPFSRARIRYGIGSGFQAWCQTWAEQCLRILKPGGHLLAMGGSRTFHRLTCGIEDAGFEIRDTITWHHGAGFPKSLNVTDALNRIVPADAHCACGQRSTQTTPDSPADYPSSHGSDDAPLPQEAADDRSSPPSPTDALGHTHGGLPQDGPGEEPASSVPGEASGHPSIEGSSHPPAPLSGESQALGSAPSGTPSSMSLPADLVNGRTPHRTLDTSGLAAGSASSSPLRYKHMTCPDCGGFDAPKGLGTALKPATEFVTVARKPLVGTVAANVLAFGTGALNIDSCRIGTDTITTHSRGDTTAFAKRPGEKTAVESGRVAPQNRPEFVGVERAGRWPANVVLDDDQARVLDRQSGELTSNPGTYRRDKADAISEPSSWAVVADAGRVVSTGDSGGASRFFLTVDDDDPDTSEDIVVTQYGGFRHTASDDGPYWRDSRRFTLCLGTSAWMIANWASGHPRGLTVAQMRDLPLCPRCAELGRPPDEPDPQRGGIDKGGASRFFYTAKASTDERTRVDGIAHPTVKPLSLMRWLVKLVTPPGGVVVDPFAGSGTTIEAAILEGFRCIAVEREPEYLPLCLARIHRRRDPVAALKLSTPDDLGLFGDYDDDPEPVKPAAGRWPANVVLDRSQAEVLDEQSGETASKASNRGDGIGVGYHGSDAEWDTVRGFDDTGGASRFFKVVEEDTDGAA